MIKPETTDAEIIAAELNNMDAMLAEITSNIVQLQLAERKLRLIRSRIAGEEQLEFNFEEEAQ